MMNLLEVFELKDNISEEYIDYLRGHCLRALALQMFDLQCKQMTATYNQFKLMVQPFIETDEEEEQNPVPK